MDPPEHVAGQPQVAPGDSDGLEVQSARQGMRPILHFVHQCVGALLPFCL